MMTFSLGTLLTVAYSLVNVPVIQTDVSISNRPDVLFVVGERDTVGIHVGASPSSAKHSAMTPLNPKSQLSHVVVVRRVGCHVEDVT